MFYSLLATLISAHVAASLLWRRFTRHEVAVNAGHIEADGSADTLRKGYHSRRGWVRFWPWLGLSVAGALPLVAWAIVVQVQQEHHKSAGGAGALWLAAGLAFLSLGILLAGFFARYFTPWLNVAMKLDYKPEFYASPDSASWPDAAAWKQVRATGQPGVYDRQPIANDLLKHLLTRTWLAARLAYAAGMLATIGAAFLHY